MLRKHTGIEIPPDNPFAHDKLKRGESAQLLSDLVASIEQPFVLSLNGRWGTGKTTFVKMWQSLLERQGHLCLYFNAWECDYTDDPLVALIAAVDEGIKARKGQGDRALATAWKKAKAKGMKLLATSAPLIAQVASHGLLSAERVQQAAGVIAEQADEVGDFAAEVVKHRLAAHKKQQRTISAFRESLTGLVASQPEREEGGTRPIIFFIDELDRCRPPFAVQLLERVKHLFSVAGIVFVLSVDREQLGQSIGALYGAGVDVDGYLRRFIDLDYQLPRASARDYTGFLFQQFDIYSALAKRHNGSMLGSTMCDALGALADAFDLTLRAQEQAVAALNVSLRITPSSYELDDLLLPTLVALRAAKYELYRAYADGQIGVQPVLDFIASSSAGRAFLDDRLGLCTEACLRAASAEVRDANDLLVMLNRTYTEEEKGDRVVYDRNIEMAGFIQRMSTRGRREWMRSHAVKQIDLTDRFRRA